MANNDVDMVIKGLCESSWENFFIKGSVFFTVGDFESFFNLWDTLYTRLYLISI